MKYLEFSKKLIISVAFSAFLVPTFLIILFLGFLNNKPILAATLEEREAELRKELERLEAEAAAVQNTLNNQRVESASIERDVNVLSSEIKKAELNIQKKVIEINNLTRTIDLKNETVAELDEKMERSKDALADIIKETNSLDNVSLPEIILGNANISDFFATMDSYTNLQNQLEKLFDQIREIRGKTEEEKEELTEQQNAELDAKKVIESEKKTVTVKKNEKDYLLAQSRETEATYAQILADRQARANAIRSALFQLRDSQGISFGDALKYADAASRSTGVRTAFILAILKQESDLGKNVGTCNRPGDPEEKKWYNIMPGPNDGYRSYRDDQSIYLRIVKGLGRDPEGTPLSCPWGTGWGGAMGPSQFIPTTWANYEARIASAVGVSLADPWNPQHAIMATAIYMKDLGAAAGGYTAERTSALKYYAGGNWSLPQNAFYGNGVMAHAEEFQNQINFLNEVEN